MPKELIYLKENEIKEIISYGKKVIRLNGCTLIQYHHGLALHSKRTMRFKLTMQLGWLNGTRGEWWLWAKPIKSCN